MLAEGTQRVFYLDIVTGDAEGADSDGAVGVLVRDPRGIHTVEQVLAAAFFDGLTRGTTDRHFMITPPSFAEPSEVFLQLKSGQSWQVHEIRLIEPKVGTRYSTGPQDVWLKHIGSAGPDHITLPLRPDLASDPATASKRHPTPDVPIVTESG